jgi:hypothetical protein
MAILFFQKQQQICLIFLCGFINECTCQVGISTQHIDPYAINVTGHSVQFNALQIDWSMGEAPMIHTLFYDKNYILSTGFLQSIYAPLHLYHQLDSFAFYIKVGPNPFSRKIIVQSKVAEVIITSIQLFDFQGNVIYKLTGQFSGINFFHEINVEKLLFPICFLSIGYFIPNHEDHSKNYKLIQN